MEAERGWLTVGRYSILTRLCFITETEGHSLTSVDGIIGFGLGSSPSHAHALPCLSHAHPSRTSIGRSTMGACCNVCSRFLTRAVAAADHVPARARGVEHHAAGKDPLASPVRLLGRPEWRCSPPHPARPFSYLSPSADACATSTRPRPIPLTRPRSSSAPPRHARSPLYPDMLAHSTTTRAGSARRRFACMGSAIDGIAFRHICSGASARRDRRRLVRRPAAVHEHVRLALVRATSCWDSLPIASQSFTSCRDARQVLRQDHVR
jgi:hypothetical protein